MVAHNAFLPAVLLAACVAGAIAGVPNEEWAERFRRLETRVEQSEAALHKRVAFLEGEVQRLRASSEQAEATAPKARTGKAAVGPMGEPEAVGRRLSAAPTCCRWTADGTCGTVPADRFEVCTHMHEYLESKTTTHEFADLDACLGPDASKWSAKFDGASSNVTLSYDAAAMATLKTPLKVTHAADCGNVPPTLNVQMDTVHDGSLTLSDGSLTLGGNEVHSAPKRLFRYDFAVNAAAGDSGTVIGASPSFSDVDDLTTTLSLTETSSLLLVHFQISYNMLSPTSGSFLACRLLVDGIEETSARSISGASPWYGTSAGTWIGEVGAGSPVIKVQCRSDKTVKTYSDYGTKALTVAILG